MIPRIIHQTWRSGRLPDALRRWQATWQRLNPDCEYRFYDDHDCLEFIKQHFPGLAGVYQSIEFGVQKADLFRYLVVYRHGGLYADMDMKCCKPFDRFFDLDTALLCIETRITDERRRELGYRRPYQIANCIFAAPPGHWFTQRLIERAVASSAHPLYSPAEIEDATGPRMLTRLYEELAPSPGDGVAVLSQIHWMPPTVYPDRWPLNINVYARHHFCGSWKIPAQKRMPLRRRWIERSAWPNPWPGRLFQA
jgi:inositol phosphorylceramide mannosyltransferase catalytic subunit